VSLPTGAIRIDGESPSRSWPKERHAMKETKGKAKKPAAPKTNASNPSVKGDMATLMKKK
jgi:hypothetical protein